MKQILLSIFILLTINSLSAQIGISAGYKTFNAEDWFALESSSNIDPYSGINIGIDYWFRLKNQRIEFLPELSYEKHSGDYGLGELSAQFYNFQFNTNIYFLDFNNDCNCPTFDKGGNFFTKGFFIQLSPGVSQINVEHLIDPEMPDSAIDESSYNFSFGIGAGVDIGLSKLITISPMVRYRFFPSVEGNLFTTKQTENTTIKQLYLGLHCAVRWNDGSNSGRSRGRRNNPFGR